MTMHAVVCGWLDDGSPSGARRRLHGLIAAAAADLDAHERLTLLLGPRTPPAELGPRVEAVRVAIPAAPAWRRARCERAVLPGLLRELGATVVELGALPVPPALPCPISLTIHDLRDLDGWRRRALPRVLVRAVVRRSLARAASVIVPSEFTAARLRAHFRHLPPLHVVPGGVSLDPPRPGPSPSEAPFVLHVGHLERRKRIDLLIDALALLPPEIGLVLVGADHGERGSLARRARRRGVSPRVSFRGTVDDAGLGTLYARADVVAVPSAYEGFGLAALEGLAHGRPVVVADRGALPEVIGSAGTVVADDDPAAWADAIETARASAAEHRDAARERARQLGWPAAARRVLEIWRSV